MEIRFCSSTAVTVYWQLRGVWPRRPETAAHPQSVRSPLLCSQMSRGQVACRWVPGTQLHLQSGRVKGLGLLNAWLTPLGPWELPAVALVLSPNRLCLIQNADKHILLHLTLFLFSLSLHEAKLAF